MPRRIVPLCIVTCLFVVAGWLGLRDPYSTAPAGPLALDAPEAAPQRAGSDVPAAAPAAVVPVRAEVAPESGCAAVRFEVVVHTEAGEPVAGATVHTEGALYEPWSGALRATPFGAAVALPTDAKGRTSVAPGPSELHALAPGRHGHALVPRGAERVEIVLHAVPATSLQVQHADGSKAAGVPVVALLPLASMAALPLARATTDAAGNAVFQDLGSCLRLANGQGFQTEAVVFAVDAIGVLGIPSAHVRQATSALGSAVLLTMPELVPMRLEVEAWPAGVDPGAAVVTATDRSGWRHSVPVASGDPRGYAVQACLGASFTVELRAPGMVGRGDGRVPDTAPLDLLTVRIRLEHRTVTLTGQVVEPRAPHLAVQAKCGRFRSDYAVCDADGRFRVDVPRAEAAGDVVLTLWSATDRPLRPKQVAVEPIRREVPLRASVDLGALRFPRDSLRGRLVDHLGRGVAGAKVQVERAQTDASDLDGDGSPINWNVHGRTSVQTDDDGRFEWNEARRGMPSDRFRFRCHAEGFVSVVSEPFDAAAGEFLLRTQPAGRIEGLVVAASRELLDGAWVSFVGPSGLGVRPGRSASQEQGGGFQRPIVATALEPGANRVCIDVSLAGISTTVWAPDVFVAAGAAAPIRVDLDRLVRLAIVRVLGADGQPIGAMLYGIGADGKPRAQPCPKGEQRVVWSDWPEAAFTVRAPGHQLRQVRLQDAAEWQLAPQAPTRFRLSMALAAQAAAAEQAWLVFSWRPPHGQEPVAEGSTLLDGGAGTRPFPSGRYACQLQLRSGGKLVGTIACADFEVPPTSPPGPVEVEVQAAR